MANKATIVTYHYVRNLKSSRYPAIKGLEVEHFKEQLRYILKYYKVIRAEELIEAVKKSKELPSNSLLLTFDDGYKDHYEYVFPILDKLGIQGSFFPPAKVVLEHSVLDVNKIQFILASVADKLKLIEEIFSILDGFRPDYSLEENQYYFQNLAVPGRFDEKEVVFIKKMLQKELPEKLRKKIINKLFSKYISENEESFSRDLYMSIDQLKYMKKKGMHIGSHGYNHYWLNVLDEDVQAREIDSSLKFLKEMGCDLDNWVMCYPYGAYNDSLLNLLHKKGCVFGLTTKIGIADLDKDNPLLLPRLDTNDLPKDANAKFSF